MELKETSLVNVVATSIQGVCFDGTYYYVTDNTKLYKYSLTGTKLAERDCSADGSVSHLGDLCVVSGVLYITANNYNNTPKVGYVMEYNASDLSYRTEYQTHAGDWISGVSHDGTDFWTVSNNNVIEKWQTGFSASTTVATDYTPAGTHGWQGIAWVDGYLLANPHEGTYPHALQMFSYDTTLELIEHIERPYQATQGIDVNGSEVVFAVRSAGNEAIVACSFVPYNYRQGLTSFSTDSVARTTTSTSYVSNTNLKGIIYAQKDDLIEVQLQGLFKSSANGLRAYINVLEGDCVDMTNPRTMRTSETSAEGESLSQIRHYRATTDGQIVFVMTWKQNGAGTATAWDRTMAVKVLVKAKV